MSITGSKKKSHGGYRPGAGRKKGSTIVSKENLRKTFGTRLPNRQIEWLKAMAKENDVPCSVLLEHIIESYQNNM